jgi:hypothetical protein
MSESSNEKKDQPKKEDDSAGISDEQLPEDLQPSEDNPLAEPLTEEEAPDDMDDLDMMGGGSDEDSGESGDEPSSDGESAEDDGED